MNKRELAEEIREIEYEKKKMDKYKISSFSDDQIIIEYIRCECCDNIPVDNEDLESAIKIAHNAEQFYIVCSFLEELRYDEYGGGEDEEENEE